MKGFFIGFGLCLLLVAVGAGAYVLGQGKIARLQPQTPTPQPTQVLVGNDKDEHGCIGSAGYSWCQAKQKCLRVWEEPCDETATIIEAMKTAIVAKRGQSANELTYTVTKVEGLYAQGGASGEGGGGMWFAAKVDNVWKLVWDGNGIILCSDLTGYPDFPKSMIPECFDNIGQKMVKR